MQAFLKEVNTLARACRHPHLIGNLGWARRGRELWSVIMYFANQGSLFDLVVSEAAQQGGAAVGLPRLLRMMAGAAAGLMHLHACDPPIIHRDIALRNLFVQSGDNIKASLLLLLLLLLDGYMD